MMRSAVCASEVRSSQSRYTGKERDAESGLDYFGARYYGSSMGRFMSPDPSGIGYSNPTNPQSFNLYSYALNNPLRFVDPTGLTACFYGGPRDTPKNDYDASDYEDVPDQATCTAYGGVSLEAQQNVNVTADNSGSLEVDLVGGGATTLIDYQTFGNFPCNGAGGAPDTSTYAAKGQAVQSTANSFTPYPGLSSFNGGVQDLSNLAGFRRGGSNDAQVGKDQNGNTYNGSTPYANYTFGVYMQASGRTLGQTLDAANDYASARSRYHNKAMDPNYPSTPATNVANITSGYNAQQNGTTCHK